MRQIALALLLATAVGAADTAPPAAPADEAPAAALSEAQYLAAARAADLLYQRRIQVLTAALQSTDEDERINAIRDLASQLDAASIPCLVPFLEPGLHSKRVVIAACQGLGHIGLPTPAGQLRHLLANPDIDLRTAAANALARIRSMGAAEWLPRAADPDPALRMNALANLGTLGHAEAADLLAAGLGDRKATTRRLCAIGIGRLGERAHGAKLIPSLCDADPQVRRFAAEAMARLDYKPAIPYLLMALESNVAGDWIFASLRILTGGEGFGFDPHANEVKRMAALERAWMWVSKHPEIKQ